MEMNAHQKAAELRRKIAFWEDKARKLEEQAENSDALAHKFEAELDELLSRQSIPPVLPLPK